MKKKEEIKKRTKYVLSNEAMMYDVDKETSQNNKHEEEKIKMSLGVIGKIFGDRDNADLSIVAVTIILGFLLVIATLVTLIWHKEASASTLNKEAINALLLFLTNITTLAFGYLFGIKR